MSDFESDDLDGPYRTLGGQGESEITVERSRFIGHAVPVGSEEEAMEIVESIRKEHYDARHVCYGLRVGRGAQRIDRSNDDGEPARTGGFPIWQLLDGDDVTDALVIVVRYYGGVKLGTGGLARAYREAAREAIDDASVVTRFPEMLFDVEVPYNRSGRVEHLIDNSTVARCLDTDYAAAVTFRVAVRKQNVDGFRRQLAEILNRDPDSFGE